MTLDTFADAFDILADAPGGIARLRQLILQLAVQGRLVEQDPNDEPASVLLKRENISAVDGIFDLPQTWALVQLNGIAQVIRGVSYKKEDATTEARPGFLPILRANSIGSDLSLDDLVYVPSSYISSNQLIREHDILIAMSSGSKNLVGKAVQASQNYQAAFGAFCGVIRVVVDIYKPYIGQYFRSPLYREAIAGLSKGIGINNLQKSALENLVIPLPPLAEQRRIVERVDQLMALCDTLETQQARQGEERRRVLAALIDALLNSRDAGEAEAAWARLRDSFDLVFDTPESVAPLRQAVLQLAVQGRLVEQDEQDEPADKLLAQIGIDVEKLEDIPESSCPYEIPYSWQWIKFGEVFDIQGGTQPPKSQFLDTPSEGYVRLLQIRDFGDNPVPTYVRADSVRSFSTEQDVMLARYGASVGKIFMGQVGAYNVAALLHDSRPGSAEHRQVGCA